MTLPDGGAQMATLQPNSSPHVTAARPVPCDTALFGWHGTCNILPECGAPDLFRYALYSIRVTRVAAADAVTGPRVTGLSSRGVTRRDKSPGDQGRSQNDFPRCTCIP